MMVAAADVLAALRCYEFRYANEDDLQVGVAAALELAGFDVEREVRLAPGDRIDMLVDAVGIEVKVAGTTASAARQCARYLRSSRVDELILVTSRARHEIELDPALPVCVHQVLRPW